MCYEGKGVMINPVSFKADVATAKPKQKEPSVNVNSVGGTIGAAVAGGAVHQLILFPFIKPLQKIMKRNGTFQAEDGKDVHDAIKKILIDSGLKEKGVRIKFLDSKIRELTPGDSFNKFIRTLFEKAYIDDVRNGYNAFFCDKDFKLPKITVSEYEKLVKSKNNKLLKEKLKETGVFIKANSVVLSKDYLHSAGVHELGHAMNCNLSKFGRFLQKCRPISMCAPMVLGLYGAFSKKSKPKTENGELTAGQKTNNFLRDNAGKLTFLAAMPMLIEEGMATYKGQKFANKLLKPELAKKVLKGNMIAYTFYLLAATLGALATTCAVKIKDNAIEKKENKIKLQQKLQAELNQVA